MKGKSGFIILFILTLWLFLFTGWGLAQNDWYYFAYGSNMNHEQMLKIRCPGSEFEKPVFLEGYRFVYDGYSYLREGAVANVIPSSGDQVWGGLYKVSLSHLLALDRYEGHPHSYQRVLVKVSDPQGNSQEVFTYMRKEKEIGLPHPDYQALVLSGAQDCHLPQDYIKSYLQ